MLHRRAFPSFCLQLCRKSNRKEYQNHKNIQKKFAIEETGSFFVRKAAYNRKRKLSEIQHKHPWKRKNKDTCKIPVSFLNNYKTLLYSFWECDIIPEKLIFGRKVKSSEELVKEIRSYLGAGLRVHLSSLVFISGADSGAGLCSDACISG